jgi:hypothetical protein
MVLFAAATMLGCVEHEHETRPPPRAVSAYELGLLDDSIGVSTTPPVRRAPPEFGDADEDAVRLFHDVLAPYGTWVDDARLGLVWLPSREAAGETSGRAFVPYSTHGRWTYREVHAASSTGEGTVPIHEYVWVSDLPWGWVTFHYGRWAYTGTRGWAWIAGRRYAGAWVDWRAPGRDGGDDGVIGWGPMPPSHLWRVIPREGLTAVPYAAFATPYTYVRTRDLFAPNLGAKLLSAAAALEVAHATEPGAAPDPARLGFRAEDVPAPPAMDRGLQQAWMLATPATASAVGAGPELPSPPHLRTWVAGGPRWAMDR